MDAFNDALNGLAEELSIDLTGEESTVAPAAGASSFAGLITTAEKTCKTLAENKANLADLQDRCARDISDLQDERRREEQEHARRIAEIDAGIEAVRAYEIKETEVWRRYIAAARGSLLELLA